MSYSLFTCCLLVSAGATVAVFYGRNEHANDWENEDKVQYVVFIYSIINALIILALDIIFKPIAMCLTKYENLKSKQMFEYSYVIKLSIFKALNNFGSLIYIAFAKKEHVGCILDSNNSIHANNN